MQPHATPNEQLSAELERLRGALADAHAERERLTLALNAARQEALDARAGLGQALLDSQATLRGVLDSATSGILAAEAVRDSQGRIVDFRITVVNPMCEKMLVHSAEVLLENTLLTLFPGITDNGLYDAYVSVTETGRPTELETYYADEQIAFWLQVSVVKVGDGVAITFTDITTRKRAEAEAAKRTEAFQATQAEALQARQVELERSNGELARQRRFAELLLQRLPAGVAYIDKDFVFRVANPVLADFYGVPLAKILDRHVYDVLPGSAKDIEALYAQVRDTLEPLSIDALPVSYSVDGREKLTYWDATILPFLDEHGAFDGWLALAFEVSERMRSEAAFKRQKDLTERIVDNTPAAIAYLNRDLVFQWANPAYAELTQIAMDRILGHSFMAVFGPETDAQVGALMRGVLETGEPFLNPDFPFTYMVDGQPRTTHWDFVYKPVHADGEVAGILVTAVETSAQRLAEAHRRESEKRYRSLFEASRDAIVIASVDRGIIDANPTFTRMFGYGLDEARGGTSRFLYTDDVTYETVGRLVAPGGERPSLVVFEIPMRRKDGTDIFVEVSSYVMFDANGRPGHLVGVLRDLTEQKEAEARAASYTRELAAQKAFAESLIRNVPTGIAYVDRELYFRVANPAYAGFLQLPIDQIVDRYVFDVVPGGKDQVEPLLREVIETGKPFYASEFPFTYTTPDGVARTTYWNFVYYPVRESEDAPVQGVFAIADEISDQVEQQREQRAWREEQA
ncbi:MAG: PAS domain-containing protein, partial [Candidatus Sericytochromatia bacterium]